MGRPLPHGSSVTRSQELNSFEPEKSAEKEAVRRRIVGEILPRPEYTVLHGESYTIYYVLCTT